MGGLGALWAHFHPKNRAWYGIFTPITDCFIVCFLKTLADRTPSHGRGQWFKPTIAHHIKQGLSALFRHVPNAGYTFGYTFSAFSLAGTLWYSLPSLVTHNAEPWQHTNLSKAERHPGAHLFGLLDFPQRHARLRPRRRPRPGPNRSNCDCSHRNAPARWHPTDSWSAALSSCERPPRSASFWIMHAQRTSESVIPSR